ncbi:MAG: bifunctional riboflavin kinase/FAD synthetase [bacterium]
MKIIRGLKHLYPDTQNAIVTLGNFDGIHLGHQKILRLITGRARELRVKSMVFTFEPHPLKILAPDRCPPLLTTFHEKMKLFQDSQVDIALCAHFTKEFASQHPEDFVRNILWEQLRAKEVFVGYNYAFGHGKKGGTALLEEISRQYPFRIKVVDEVRIAGEKVSSTAIRNYIQQGDLEKASLFLGRPYTLSGTVVHGSGRGKSLGYPTANIYAGSKLIPKFGVYLVRIHIQGRIYNGLANIGQKPTFGGSPPGVEVYIFDFQSDLYQQRLEIELMRRIRDEILFPDKGCLTRQIKSDVSEAQRIFEHEEKDTRL